MEKMYYLHVGTPGSTRGDMLRIDEVYHVSYRPIALRKKEGIEITVKRSAGDKSPFVESFDDIEAGMKAVDSLRKQLCGEEKKEVVKTKDDV